MVLSEVRTTTSFLKLQLSSNSCTIPSQFLAATVSIFLLVFFSTVITANLFVGNPIECTRHSESELTQEFVHAFCWNENMFSIPSLQEDDYQGMIPYPGVGPRPIFGRQKPIIVHVYYQWVPLVFALQALLIGMPQFLWKNQEKGQIKGIISYLNNSNLVLEELNARCLTVAKYLLSSQKSRKAMRYFHWFWICSLLQVLSLVIVAWSTNMFLGGKFAHLGPKVLNYWYFGGKVNPVHSMFPRMAKCTLEHFGPSGTLQTSDVLCFLSASLWHSRVFVILWWWFCVAIGLSAFGFILSSIFSLRKTRIYFITSPLLTRSHHQECMRMANDSFSVHDCLILYSLRRSIQPFYYAQILTGMLTSNSSTNTILNMPEINPTNSEFPEGQDSN